MLKFKDESKEAAIKLGFKNNELSWLGEGEYGAVYEIENTDKAIKITVDEDEILTSLKLLNHDTKFHVNIYEVLQIEEHKYAIIMDKVDTKNIPQLFDMILKEAEQQMVHYTDIDFENTFYGLPNEAKELIQVLIDSDIEAKILGFENNDISINNIGRKNNGQFVVFDQHSGCSKLKAQNELNKKSNKKKIKH